MKTHQRLAPYVIVQASMASWLGDVEFQNLSFLTPYSHQLASILQDISIEQRSHIYYVQDPKKQAL